MILAFTHLIWPKTIPEKKKKKERKITWKSAHEKCKKKLENA